MKEGCAKPDPLWISVATADGWIPPKGQVSRRAGKVRTSMATPSMSNVLRGMDLTHLTKKESAKKELAEKGMALG
jgi:hypothetical protein